MRGLRVTFLGTGTSVGIPVVTCRCDVCTSDAPRNRRLRASLLLEWGTSDGGVAKVLVDTSTDLRQQALRQQLDRIDAVLYTHGHADHVLGLDELRIFNFVHRRAIPLCGDDATLEALQQMFHYAFDPAAVGVPRLTLHELGTELELFGQRVDVIPLGHGSSTVQAFRIGGFGYATDCNAIPDTSAERLKDLDVLVLDALRRRPHRSHFGVDQAVAEIERLGPRQAYLTHLSHDLDHAALEHELPEGIGVAHDEMVLELELPAR